MAPGVWGFVGCGVGVCGGEDVGEDELGPRSGVRRVIHRML